MLTYRFLLDQGELCRQAEALSWLFSKTGSGNCQTSQKSLRFVIYLQNENLWLTLKVTIFNHRSILRISLGYYVNQFPQVMILFHLMRKSQNEKFLEFFSRFRFFVKLKNVDFSQLCCWASFIDSYHWQNGVKLTLESNRRIPPSVAAKVNGVLQHLHPGFHWKWNLITVGISD